MQVFGLGNNIGHFVGAIPLWLPLLGQAQGPAPTMADVRTNPKFSLIRL